MGVKRGSLFRFSGSSPVDFDDERKKKDDAHRRSIDRSRVVCVLVGKGDKDTKSLVKISIFDEGEISLRGGSCVIFHMNSVCYGYSTVHVNIL